MALAEKYINPYTDFGFKKLFGTEPNKDLIIDFFNEVVLPEDRKIVDPTFKQNEQIGNTELDRRAIFDLYCIGSNGERFIVEMQKVKQNYFKDRSVFYASFPIQEQAQKGNWDYQLTEVYTVGVLDFVFSEAKATSNEIVKEGDKIGVTALPKKKQVPHVVKLRDENCQVFYNKLTFIYLEMPNFELTEEELESTYDKWLYVLKHLPELNKRPDRLREKIFGRLFEAAEIAKFTSIEKDLYEDSIKVYRDLKNSMDTAKDEGKVEGKIEGKIEGRLEAQTEAIINFLKMNLLSVEEIANAFNVSANFVLQIKKEHNL